MLDRCPVFNHKINGPSKSFLPVGGLIFLQNHPPALIIKNIGNQIIDILIIVIECISVDSAFFYNIFYRDLI